MILTGYKHPNYALSLSEFGEPISLPKCGGYLLKRVIPNSQAYDAMGCYPLFACSDWSMLGEDLNLLDDQLVSLAVVTDPFGQYDVKMLQGIFRDRVFAFKTHFVTDLTRPNTDFISGHRRRMALRALRKMEVEIISEPVQYVDEWTRLYSHLIDHHHVQGIRAYSHAAFTIQFGLPNTYYVRAIINNQPIGAQVCFLQDNVVHCHLAAFTEAGYDFGASYALDWASIDYFTGKAHWYNMGGGVGVNAESNDGLSLYKRGWASDTRTAYFCGRIINQKLYESIALQFPKTNSSYFPVYRDGEYA